MKIKVKGEMSIPEIRQAIVEKLFEVENEYAVHHSRGATLFINPTNGFGDDVRPCNKHGRSVENIYSEGPYRSAADDYKI